MSSANLAAAAAYKNSVHELGPDFIYKAFYAFKTMLHATVAEGNKGKRTLTEIMVGDLVYAWNKNFNPRQNAIDYRPREIEVVAQKFDLAFVPQEYEATYLGAARKKGQNPGSDLPAEAEHMMLIMAKIAAELENAVLRGQIDNAIAVNDRKIIQNMNGFLKVIAMELAAGTISPVAVSGGAWTETNVVPTLEAMVRRLDPQVKDQPLTVYAPYHVVEKYKSAYRDNYGKFTGALKPDDGIMIDMGQAKMVSLPGLGTSNRVLITPQSNVLIDYDSFGDTTTFNIETEKRELHLYGDFKMGVNLGIVDNGIVSVCDLA